MVAICLQPGPLHATVTGQRARIDIWNLGSTDDSTATSAQAKAPVGESGNMTRPSGVRVQPTGPSQVCDTAHWQLKRSCGIHLGTRSFVVISKVACLLQSFT
jgi:hypothetical protein